MSSRLHLQYQVFCHSLCNKTFYSQFNTSVVNKILHPLNLEGSNVIN